MKTNLESSKLSVSSAHKLYKMEKYFGKRQILYSDMATLKYIHNGVNENSCRRLVYYYKYDNNTAVCLLKFSYACYAMSPKSIDIDDLDKENLLEKKIFFQVKEKIK